MHDLIKSGKIVVLTCSRYKLVVVFIHKGLHVAVQRADLLDHACLLIHQLCKGALLPHLYTNSYSDYDMLYTKALFLTAVFSYIQSLLLLEK